MRRCPARSSSLQARVHGGAASLLVVFGVLLASGYLARLTRPLAQFTGLAI